MAAQTLYEKIWNAHVVRELGDGAALIYVDRHLVHEVTSPQAFDGLRLAGRRPWRAGANVAVPDHNVPTTDRARGIEDPISREQVQALRRARERAGVGDLQEGGQALGVHGPSITNGNEINRNDSLELSRARP